MDTNINKQFSVLIDQNTGAKLGQVIVQILESNIININEFLNHKNVQALNNPLNSNKHFNTFWLFNSGSYTTYKGNKSTYIDLTDKMLSKLRILTLIDLSKETKTFSTPELMKTLDISDSFVLDRLIFDCNSQGIITGKINQKEQQFKILFVAGRDNISSLDFVKFKFARWQENVAKAEEFLDREIQLVRQQTKEFTKKVDSMVDIGKKFEAVTKEKMDNYEKLVKSSEEKDKSKSK